MGRPLVEERFGDYREVDGVQFTFSARVAVGGQPALERTVTSLTVGGTLDPRSSSVRLIERASAAFVW